MKNIVPDKNVQTQNKRGEWVPAIPLPYFFQVLIPYTQCDCGQKFFGSHRKRALERYEEHYALKHILKPEESAPIKPLPVK